MTPVWPLQGGGGGGGGGVKFDLLSRLSTYGSYYLPIHFMGLNAILKKIIGGFT